MNASFWTLFIFAEIICFRILIMFVFIGKLELTFLIGSVLKMLIGAEGLEVVEQDCWISIRLDVGF